MTIGRKMAFALTVVLTSASLFAQTSNDDRMAWWRDARFGMFIHWGVYAVPAGTYNGQKIGRIGEWIMNRGKIPVAEYKKYAGQFNPVDYDPDAWVRMAKDAGMKYIVITAKHHDGFALFDSKASSWDVVDATPYGRDLIAPLAEACRRHGIKLGLYYSQAQDWVSPGGAAARRKTTEGWANPDSVRIDAYTESHDGHWDPEQTSRPMSEYINEVAVPQVREILTNYGDISVLWWDTPTGMTDEYAEKLKALLALQPNIITNDRLKRPNYPGDFKTPEQRIPNLAELDGKDWETCMTMNGTWGYKSYDDNWKSSETMIRNLIDIASKGGNYLLNVGPKANGEFPTESIARLKQMGEWMRVNGEAIYGTKASSLPPIPWGRCTRKEVDNKTLLYLSVFDWPADGKLLVPGLTNAVRRATLLQGSKKLRTETGVEGTTIFVPAQPVDPKATVIKLEMESVQAQEWRLKSPDKKIEVTVSNKANKLTWSATYEKKPAIETSPLGIVRSDQNFSENMKFVSKKESVVDDEYSLMVGKNLQCHDKGNELTLTFENSGKEQMQVIFRTYNDGTAFRYNFTKTDREPKKIIKEESAFVINPRAKSWIQPYDMNSRLKPCYETFYESGIAVGTPSPNPAGWSFPALFNVDNIWMLITEAGLDETYPATHLNDTKDANIYSIRFPEKEEVTSNADPEPVSTLPWKTPWRVAVIGSSLATIQESTLVTALNPPSMINDVSWIKPGRSSWSWWSDGSTPKDFDAQKRYIEFTADMQWQYVLIDAGWPLMKNGNMEDLIKYANSKNVGIVLWYHSGMGREKDTLSYANVMAFPEERRKEFQKIQAWGAKGVKVDFFDSDKQPVIQRYMDILRDAAKYKIMVNFHGSTLPRGWERTYPHLVSMESVKGAEGAGRQEFCDRAPAHNTILPFTRNVVGSMDYTPVTFTNKREAIRRTTFAHELALAVVFESGVFHFADNMKSYQSLPEGPKGFLKQVPTTWDETRYVAAIPGKYVLVARRKGSMWYIAGINGQNTSQDIEFDLPFLNDDGSSLAFITDGQQPGTFAETTMKLKKKGNKVNLLPNGGFVLYRPALN